MSKDRYQKALAVARDEVLKIIARHVAPPEVQRHLGIIELIRRTGVDIRTHRALSRRLDV